MFAGSYQREDISFLQEAASAVSIQYTSLILIVLTIVVGFSSVSKPQNLASALQVYPEKPPIGDYSYDDIFNSGGSNLENDRFDALAEILLSHDLYAQIDVFADFPKPALIRELNDEQIGLALARAMSISKKLIERGVPQEALQVQAVLKQSTTQVDVRFSYMPFEDWSQQ